jgi:hypothetical protein
MATYYEMLKLPPAASAAEIVAAYESQYELIRRLVNHPTQGLIAQQSIADLEHAREVLTDPIKRAAYDAENAAIASTAGLADPEIARSQHFIAPPPVPLSTPRTVNAPQSARTRNASLWECSKCASENPPNTQFCLNCGVELVRLCPGCNRVTSLVATGFCGACGSRWETANRKVRIDEERRLLINELSVAQSSSQVDVEQLGGEFTEVVGRIKSLRMRAAPFLPGGIVGVVINGFIWLVLTIALSWIFIDVFRLSYWFIMVAACIIPPLMLAVRQSMSINKAGSRQQLQAEYERLAQLKAQREQSIQRHISDLTASLERINRELLELGSRDTGHSPLS